MNLSKNAKSNVIAPDEIRFKFISDSVLKAFEADGKKFCRLTASSNGEDLVGDVMSQKALEQMKDAAVGTVMFMNHSTNVPEDVFGTVVEATLGQKSADVLGGGSSNLQCLEYLVEVQEDNDRAMKTWQMIGKGTKLGASVTVLVRDKSPNPKRNKGIIIEEVEYLETSIVGIPCNRQSWVSSAKKALEQAEQRAAKQVEGESMEVETAEVTAETTPEVTPEVAPAVASPLSRSVASFDAYKAMVAAVAEKGVAGVEAPSEVVVKGMFNEIMNQKPRFWELCDILCNVKYQIESQIYYARQAGATDLSVFLDTYAEAIDEFKAAAIDSFKFWAKFEAEEEDDVVSAGFYTLQQIEEVLKSIGEVIKAAPDEETRTAARASGTQLLEVAKNLGLITVPDSAEAQIPEITVEQIEKSAHFVALAEKAAAAEAANAVLIAEHEKTKEDLGIAKAGLTAANAVIESHLRQPMKAKAA